MPETLKTLEGTVEARGAVLSGFGCSALDILNYGASRSVRRKGYICEHNGRITSDNKVLKKYTHGQMILGGQTSKAGK